MNPAEFRFYMLNHPAIYSGLPIALQMRFAQVLEKIRHSGDGDLTCIIKTGYELYRAQIQSFCEGFQLGTIHGAEHPKG